MIDSVDRTIIKLLQQNARIQWKDIGEVIHMSGPAVANRVKKMEDEGIIEGYSARVNEQLLGNHQCIFITVMIKEYRHSKFTEFIHTRNEIKEAHRVSGEPCFILKVQLSDQLLLANLLDEILVYGYYKINISIGQIK